MGQASVPGVGAETVARCNRGVNDDVSAVVVSCCEINSAAERAQLPSVIHRRRMHRFTAVIITKQLAGFTEIVRGD